MDQEKARPSSSSGQKLHTGLCDLLGIEFPIIQAGMGMGSSAELAVAVSNAGGLGSLGCFRRPPEDLEKQLSVIRERTGLPFAVNHLVTELNETAFAMTLAARPPVISFALGHPGELVRILLDENLPESLLAGSSGSYGLIVRGLHPRNCYSGRNPATPNRKRLCRAVA